jgi:hypothetical protein
VASGDQLRFPQGESARIAPHLLDELGHGQICLTVGCLTVGCLTVALPRRHCRLLGLCPLDRLDDDHLPRNQELVRGSPRE